MMDRFCQAFLDEVPDHLAELETALLELDSTPNDRDLVQRVFRAMHTIKGSAAMFGFDAASRFAHELETAFDHVREGRLVVTPDLVNLTLEARDEIKAMLLGANDCAPDLQRQLAIVERLRGLCGALAAPAARSSAGTREDTVASATASPRADSAPAGDARQRWRIRFRPAPDILLQGSDPLLILRDLRALGALEIVADTTALPPLDQLNPEICYLEWNVVLTSERSRDAIRDVFIFVEDGSEIEILSDTAPGLAPVTAPTATASPAATAPASPATSATPAAATTPAATVTAAAEHPHAPDATAHGDGTAAAAKPTVRVAADKLDALVNIVGELVVMQARLTDLAVRSESAEMLFIAEEVERLTAGLRDNAMSIRMLPLRGTFDRFRRLVHDLTRDLNKEIEFRTEGGETELDKTVIDQLGDPLLHLIRNCADHGIEDPDARVAAGKPRAGTICISAVHAGASVLIRVADDGRGLDSEAVRARAVAKGLISADATLSESDTLALVMSPGFSTAARVTGISGRGVGMDVVRRSVDALRGTVEIASRPGEGTEVTLRLPLTLAIIDGLLVRVQTTHFVVPLSTVVECIELSAVERGKHRKHIVNVRGELIPYIPLRAHFGIAGDRPPIEQIMIVETRNGRCGFVVDEVLGNHQTVIKTLGRVYRSVQVISGATILGDGSVALILDPHRLVEAATSLATRPDHLRLPREEA